MASTSYIRKISAFLCLFSIVFSSILQPVVIYATDDVPSMIVSTGSAQTESGSTTEQDVI